MRERQVSSTKPSTLVTTGEEFDRLMAQALPDLLDHATGHMRRFLRETGQWADDISHEKLALRWGYDLFERFLVCGRAEIPCRPFFLLDSFIAKFLSQPEPLCYHKELLTPLGRFLDGLTARAVLSRDALIALFYHLYGFGQSHVVRLLGLGPVERQRVYKNFERWRRTGWLRAVEEIGLTDVELHQIEDEKCRYPERLTAEMSRLLSSVQAHYRKSEPEHFRCLTAHQWAELFREEYGYDYRVWHLALCRECLLDVHAFRQDRLDGIPPPRIDLHVRPLQRSGVMALVVVNGGDSNGDGAGRPTQRLSRTSA
ncbi:MAG: hypothetical protein ACREIO_10525 [Nitrospiraceae bacterium]